MSTIGDRTYDRIANANARQVNVTSMKVLDAIQDSPPDVQIAGAAVVFLALAKKFDIEPSVCMNIVDNLIKDSRMYDKGVFKGVQEYIENEV